MIGLWLENGELSLRDDLPRPEPAGGEVLVRVIRAGICNTDIELVRGYYPFTGVPGHEFVGIVEYGPSGLSGRRVVGEINAVCGTCPACRAGRRTHCPNRTVLGIVGRNGCFAEFLSLPLENLHPVPDEVPTDAAVFTEPLAAALEIREQVVIGPAERVLVVGDGKLGQLIARTLKLTGCDLLVAGRHASKTARLEAAGIRTCAAGEDGLAGETAGIEKGAFDVTVECTGNAAGFSIARRALRPRGTLVMKSTYAGDLTVDASALVVDEITLVGSRCGPFGPAMNLLAGRQLDPRDLIDARYPLARAREGFERAVAPGTLKVLLDMD